MTEFYIIREYNGGTQFKPQKVYALRNYFTQWFYTFEECLKECEIRQANAILETTSDLEVLKKKVRELEEKKRRLVNAGLHPESKFRYSRFPIGWSEMSLLHPELLGFGWSRGMVRSIRIEAGNDVGPGFIYDIVAPAMAVDCRLRIGAMTAQAKIENGRIRFMNPTPNVKRIDVYVRCTALDTSKFFMNTNPADFIKNPFAVEGCRTGRFSGIAPNIKEVDHRSDVLRYAFGGYQCGKTALRDVLIAGNADNADNAREMLERFHKGFTFPMASNNPIRSEEIIDKAKAASFKFETPSRKTYDAKEFLESAIKELCEEINKRI